MSDFIEYPNGIWEIRSSNLKPNTNYTDRSFVCPTRKIPEE
jgi:hypothetical protein